ncbi:hypothetical protein NDU88_000260, partial [Pleurodeles waltl]
GTKQKEYTLRICHSYSIKLHVAMFQYVYTCLNIVFKSRCLFKNVITVFLLKIKH